MKLSLMLLSIILIIAGPSVLLAQNEIPNPGFENWTGTNLDGWSHNSSAPPYETVTKSTDAYAGSFAVRGESISIAGYGAAPSLLTGPPGGDFFPISENFTFLSGYYQHDIQGGDELLIEVILVNLDTGGGAEGHVNLSGNVDSYTMVEIPIVYDDDNPPDFQATGAVIAITILPPDGQLPTIGNYFLLDNLSFEGVIGIEDGVTAIQQKVEIIQNYPNPFQASTTFAFSLPQASNVSLSVYNLTGQQVSQVADQWMPAGGQTLSWQAGELPAGTYLYRLKTENGNTQTQKMVLLK